MKRPRVGAVLLGLLAALLALPLLLDRLVLGAYARRGVGSTVNTLKTVISAQEDFRRNDRDGNGKADYWRPDIQGLYSILPPGSNEEIKLIMLSLAEADDRPAASFGGFTAKRPAGGYWFRALRFGDETSLSGDRFAALAFPEEPAGRRMFVVSHAGVMWSKDAVAGGVNLFPADPAAEGWTRLP